MNVTTQITEKDRRLLIFLAVFVIVMGFGWFLIRPAIKESQDLDTQIAYAETQKREIDYNISRIDENKQALTSSVSAYSAKAEAFYPVMKSQEIENLFTSKALSSGFAQSALRELTIQYPDSNLVLGTYLAAEKPDETKDALPGIYAAGVTFTLYGARSALENFLDVLAADGSMRVVSFVWNEDRETDGNYLLTVNLQVFMTDSETTAANAQTILNSGK